MSLFRRNADDTRVIDQVCGMKVEPAAAAASSEFEGVTYFFCSKGCAAAFEVDPRRYLR